MHEEVSDAERERFEARLAPNVPPKFMPASSGSVGAPQRLASSGSG